MKIIKKAVKAIADMTDDELDRAQEEAAARGDKARSNTVFDELVKRGLRVDYRMEDK